MKSDDPKDLKKAFKLLRKAAKKGDPDAQFLVGWKYKIGEGVAEHAPEANRWYRKAAEQGLHEATRSLARLWGPPKDQ